MNRSTPALLVHHQLPEFTQTHVHRGGDAVQPSHPLSPTPPAPNNSQHQGLFQWVSSLHEVAKALELQLQHQSFQWTPRTDLLEEGLVGSPCIPRDSQESSPTPQFQSIHSSALSFLHSPNLKSMHNHWKKHRLAQMDLCGKVISLLFNILSRWVIPFLPRSKLLLFIYFFKFYFIFKLYIIVLVLPNIKMNPPQVYMCSPSWILLPPPSPYHPSGSSQCTSPKHPVSCIEPGQQKSKRLLISRLQPTSVVILELKKIKSGIVSTMSPSICHEVLGPDTMIFVFWMLRFKLNFHSPLSLSSRGFLVPLQCLP